MKRHIQGLREPNASAPTALPDGLFLVRVLRTQHRGHASKPYYSIALAIVEPTRYIGQSVAGRIYCTPKALWKLNWFLRDFGYDTELLDRDEIDDRRLIGLTGVVKLSRAVVNGTAILNLDGFAPASQWEELQCTTSSLRDENNP